MARPRSLGWPITLGVVMLVLLVALTVFFVLLGAAAQARYSGLLVGLGSVLLVLVIVGVVLYLLLSVKEVRLNQRQSNFIDSVTHELKSPLASLKLYLQTLVRRSVTEQQQGEFYRLMLEDVERLDTLIDHLLDAARLDRVVVDEEELELELAPLLASCAETVCQRLRVDAETVQLDLTPTVVRGRAIDIEMIFRNLIDNAVKYGGDPPRVRVESWPTGRATVLTRISDNGPGIPIKLRRKVFGRFVRLGSELERSRTGTGLGLYIVRTLVRRLRGKVSVRGGPGRVGTVFEVELPGGPATDGDVETGEAPTTAITTPEA